MATPDDYLNALADKTNAFVQAGSPKDLEPDMKRFAMDAYAKLYKTGYMASGEGQQIGHKIRGLYGIQDPTQGKPGNLDHSKGPLPGVPAGTPIVRQSGQDEDINHYLDSTGKPYLYVDGSGYSVLKKANEPIAFYDRNGRPVSRQQYGNIMAAGRSTQPGSNINIPEPPDNRSALDRGAMEFNSEVNSDNAGIAKAAGMVGRGLDWLSDPTGRMHQWIATHDRWLPQNVQTAITQTPGPLSALLPSVTRMVTGLPDMVAQVGDIGSNAIMPGYQPGDNDRTTISGPFGLHGTPGPMIQRVMNRAAGAVAGVNQMVGGDTGAPAETAQAILRMAQHRPDDAKQLLSDAAGKIATGVITDPAPYVLGAKYFADDFMKPISEALTIRKASELRAQQMEAVGKGDMATATELGVQATRYERTANSMATERHASSEGAHGVKINPLYNTLDAANKRMQMTSGQAQVAWKGLASKTPGTEAFDQAQGNIAEPLPKNPAAGLEEFQTGEGFGGLETDNSPTGMLTAPEMRETIKQQSPSLYAQVSQGVGSPDVSASLASDPELLDIMGAHGYQGQEIGETPNTVATHGPLGGPVEGGVGIDPLDAIRQKLAAQVMPAEDLPGDVGTSGKMITRDPLTSEPTGVEDINNPLLKQGELGGPVEAPARNYPVENAVSSSAAELDAIRERLKQFMPEEKPSQPLTSKPPVRPDWAPEHAPGVSGYDAWEETAREDAARREAQGVPDEHDRWFGPDGHLTNLVRDFYKDESGHVDPAEAVKRLNKMLKDLGNAVFSEKTRDYASGAFPGITATEGAKNLINQYHFDSEVPYAQLVHQSNEITKLFDKMPDVFKLKFLDNYENGKPQGSPEAQAIDDFIRKNQTAIDAERHRVDPDATSIENHLGHRWATIPGTGGKVIRQGGMQLGTRRPLSGNTSFNKQRVYGSVAEGIAHGGVPKTLNPMVMMHMDYFHTMKYVAMKDLYKSAIASGYGKYIDGDSSKEIVTTKDAAGDEEEWKAVHDDSSRVYARRPDGEPYTKGRIYLRKDLADMVNNHLDEDKLKNFPGVNSLIWLKNLTTQAELIGPAFHLINEATESAGSQVGSALNALATHGPGAMLSELNPAKNSPLSKYKEGNLWRQLYQQQASEQSTWLSTTEAGKQLRSLYKNAPELFTLLAKHGLRDTMPADLQNHAYRAMVDGINSVLPANKIKGVVNIPAAILEASGKWLFDGVIPSLKWAVATRELSKALVDYGVQLGERPDANGVVRAPVITRDQLAKRIVTMTDARFGEINWERLHLPRSLATASQLTFRASGWFLGNILAPGLTLKYAWEDMLHNANAGDPLVMGKKDASGQVQGGLNRNPHLAWAIGTSVFGIMVNSLIQHSMTGLYPGQKTKSDKPWSDLNLAKKDIVFPRTNPDDPHERISPPGMVKDLAESVVEPKQFVSNKLASVFHTVPEARDNTDYRNVQITDSPDTPGGMLARMLHVAGQPIGGVSGGAGALMGGIGNKVAGPLGGMAGTFGGAAIGSHFFPNEEQATMPEGRRFIHMLYTGKPPSALVSDPFERYIQAVRKEQGQPVRTLAQDAKYKAVSLIRKTLSADPGQRTAQLQQAVADGKLTMQQAEEMMTADTHAPWQIEAVKGIPLQDIPEAWERADRDEKAKINPIIIERIYAKKNIEKILADPALHKRLVGDKLMSQ